MGVFDKYWKIPEVEKEQEEISDPIKPVVDSNEIHCKFGHVWNGTFPSIDPSILEIQHPDLINKPCDCKRALYNEGVCTCGEGKDKKWELKFTENTSG